MDIRFCERCQQSIPDADFDAGRALDVEGRSFHVACALSRSLSLAGPRAWLGFVLALYAAGVATFLLVQTLRGAGKEDGVSAAVAERIDERAGEAEEAAVARARQRLAEAQQGVEDRVAEALQQHGAVLVARLDELGQRVQQGEQIASDHLSAMERRLVQAETEVRVLGELVRDAMAQASAEVARPPATGPTPPPREPPEPTPPMEGPEERPGTAPAPPPEPAADPEEVDRWLRRLDDANHNVRFTATLELGRLKDLRASPRLVEVLQQDRDYYVRLGAATALGEMQSLDAFLPLVDALLDSDALVRTAANDAVWAIAGISPDLQPEEAREPFHFVSEMSASERRRVVKRWKDWWKDHESDMRVRLGQPKQ